jgi:hypothetical protein
MLKEIDDYWGAENATRSGMYGALGYAGLLVLTAVLLFADLAGIPFSRLDGGAQTVILGLLGAELGVTLLAAYRFSMGKGLIPGSITLALFLLEIVLKLIQGTIPGLLWWVAYFAIIMGLINGIRGAWAMRTMQHPGDVVEAFE